jgi:hypothetical protein
MGMTTISKLEALADSIIASSAYSDPTSVQYKYRNPLGLMAFCRHAKPYKKCTDGCSTPKSDRHEYDPKTGLRIFKTHVRGYQCALSDLEIKCSDRSYSKVRKTSSIRELIRSYYLPDGTAGYAARFLRKALGDETITEETRIEYFMSTTEKETVNA